MNNEFGIRLRFDEREFLSRKMKAESTYIADTEINSILDDYPDLQDVTFTFVPIKSGFLTRVINNNTNTKISLDELNLVTFDFYIKQSELISVMQAKARDTLKEERQLEQRAEIAIQKIKDILYKWDDNRKGNKLQTV